MRDRGDVVHEDIGSDGLEVEEDTVEKQRSEESDVQRAVDLVQVHHKVAGWHLNHDAGNTGVKLELRGTEKKKKRKKEKEFYVFT